MELLASGSLAQAHTPGATGTPDSSNTHKTECLIATATPDLYARSGSLVQREAGCAREDNSTVHGFAASTAEMSSFAMFANIVQTLVPR
jgi:hypothetical protein